jgi:hypothetical protein
MDKLSDLAALVDEVEVLLDRDAHLQSHEVAKSLNRLRALMATERQRASIDAGSREEISIIPWLSAPSGTDPRD